MEHIGGELGELDSDEDKEIARPGTGDGVKACLEPPEIEHPGQEVHERGEAFAHRPHAVGGALSRPDDVLIGPGASSGGEIVEHQGRQFRQPRRDIDNQVARGVVGQNGEALREPLKIKQARREVHEAQQRIAGGLDPVGELGRPRHGVGG